MPTLTLTVIPETLAVCRLNSDEPIPPFAIASPFFSITRTPDELSIVCRQEDIPAELAYDGDWRGLKIEDEMEFSMVGILAALASPLAQANISIFCISTYNTDYLLVKASQLSKAVQTLSRQGHRVLNFEF